MGQKVLKNWSAQEKGPPLPSPSPPKEERESYLAVAGDMRTLQNSSPQPLSSKRGEGEERSGNFFTASQSRRRPNGQGGAHDSVACRFRIFKRTKGLDRSRALRRQVETRPIIGWQDRCWKRGSRPIRSALR